MAWTENPPLFLYSIDTVHHSRALGDSQLKFCICTCCIKRLKYINFRAMNTREIEISKRGHALEMNAPIKCYFPNVDSRSFKAEQEG